METFLPSSCDNLDSDCSQESERFENPNMAADWRRIGYAELKWTLEIKFDGG
jgi:hypothetical protein